MSSWVMAEDVFLYALQALVVSPSSQPCQCRLPQSSNSGRKCEKRMSRLTCRVFHRFASVKFSAGVD